MTDSLVEFVKHEVKLNQRQEDGETLKAHLTAVYNRTKKMPEQLKPPEVNKRVIYLLYLFSDLSQGRQSGMAINSISSAELMAWMQITGRNLNAWEIATLRAMDKGFMNG